MAKAAPAFDFEASVQELERIVRQMETEPLTLEQSLAQYERGVSLTRACQKSLSDAEQKIKVISQADMAASSVKDVS